MNPTINNNNNNNNNNNSIENFVMKNCVMILSTKTAAKDPTSDFSDDVGARFTCKTCGRKFDSFQALGGHCASHKKLKPEATVAPTSSSGKPKSHACGICGVEFQTGQALGGHMRKHRSVAVGSGDRSSTITATQVSVEKSVGNNKDVKESSEKSVGNNGDDKKRENEDVLEGEVVKKLRVEEVCLDLNLGFSPWVIKKLVKDEIEDGEIVEEVNEDKDDDFLKLELRLPIRV